MTDHDMKKLKDLPTPLARVGARKAAIAAAVSEFDAQSAKDGLLEPTIAEGITNRLDMAPKGNGLPGRQSNASIQNRRISGMRLTSKYAIAASIAAVTIAVPGAYYYLSEGEQPGLHGVIGRSPDTRRVEDFLAGLKDGDREAFRRNKSAANKRKDGKRTALITPPEPERLGKLGDLNSTGRVDVVTPPTAGLGAIAERGASPAITIVDGVTRTKVGKPKEDKSGAVPVPRAARPAMVVGKAQPTSSGLNQPPLGLGALSGRRSVAGLDNLRSSRDRLLKARASSSREQRGEGFAARSPGFVAEILAGDQQEYRDRFETVVESPVKQVGLDPVSTFSIDVDTASYSFVRRALNGGRLPPKASVRVEELVNYFPYDYAAPESAQEPFNIDINVVPAPWRTANKLVHISVKGYELNSAERPRANLVFLVDVSGSMGSKDKLPLVRNALRMLVDELQPDDTIGIVTYASGSGVALEPTKVKDKAKILAAINSFRSGGSTAGAQGISDAYRLAEANFDPEGVNRIILATDGDFNVGVTDGDSLQGYIERKREAGIFLSILGFGQGNYNDALMQVLAQNGNGTASYIDTLNEARKVLVDEASSTLFTIAKDVKIQVEFNPKRVSSYRLIGYETRALKREDFNNDKVDAGDVGSGHSITAIYEITPVGAPSAVDDLRYGKAEPVSAAPSGQDGEIGFLKLRYKLPKEDTSRLLSQTISGGQESDSLQSVSTEVRFAIAVGAFGQVLRGSSHVGDFGFDDIVALAKTAKGDDPFGYRAEFINLVRLAKSAQP